jgi:hypothetical protein
MGGWGSGRPPSRATIEDALFCLSIHEFTDRDLLRPGVAFTLAGTAGTEADPTVSIKVQIDTVNPVHPALAELATQPVPARLRAVLHYPAIIQPDAPPETVRDEIWFDRKARGFAAAGWQFICPGCGRRVADLYLLDLYFRCRRCGKLGYPSQRQSPEIRGLQKAARLKRQLGGAGEYAEPVPERPKGMHRSTYERLCRAVADAEAPWQQEQLRGLQQLLMQCGRLPEGDQADLAQTARAAKRALLKPELLKRRNRARGRPRTGRPNP